MPLLGLNLFTEQSIYLNFFILIMTSAFYYKKAAKLPHYIPSIISIYYSYISPFLLLPIFCPVLVLKSSLHKQMKFLADSITWIWVKVHLITSAVIQWAFNWICLSSSFWNCHTNWWRMPSEGQRFWWELCTIVEYDDDGHLQ